MSIVASMKETYQGTGHNQHAADLKRRTVNLALWNIKKGATASQASQQVHYYCGQGKPITGEITSEIPISSALPQFTPLPP